MNVVIDAPVVCLVCKTSLRHHTNEGIVYIDPCRSCGHYEDLVKQFCFNCVHRYSDQNCCNALEEIDYIRGAFVKCVGRYFKKGKAKP
jgi:hypothetical protein